MPFKKEINFGLLGILASVLVGIGEFLVHYSATGYDTGISFGFFANVNSHNLNIGQVFILLGIPLYFVGYYHFYLIFKQKNKRIAQLFFVFGVVSFIYGGIWVSSRAFLGQVNHIVLPNHPELWAEIVLNYNLLLENLVNILRFTILVVSGLFVYLIIKKDSPYPKWMALFNPFLLLAIVFLFFKFVPSIGNYLISTAMNVAHILMFSASVFTLYKLQKNTIQ